MKKITQSLALTTGVAIFTMFFGAGNLMFPLKVGSLAGTKVLIAALGFVITAVLLPILGIICSLLFYGDYNAFFDRIGKVPGTVLIFLCMLMIGPLIVMPRIVAFSYEIARPHIPAISLLLFSVLFVALTFVLTYRPNKIITLLGSVIGPLKLGLLLVIIIKGLITGKSLQPVTELAVSIFGKSLVYGYGTLDLLGAIFFGSMIYSVLKKNLAEEAVKSTSTVLRVALQGAAIGTLVLGAVYVALQFLGALHGADLAACTEGEIFSTVCMRIIGPQGALLTAAAVIVACLSTLIALSTVLAQYVSETLSSKRIGYVTALMLVLGFTLIPANLGLGKLLEWSRPLINVMYPILIILTICNTAYKLFGFRWVKTPVLITLLGALYTVFLR